MNGTCNEAFNAKQLFEDTDDITQADRLLERIVHCLYSQGIADNCILRSLIVGEENRIFFYHEKREKLRSSFFITIEEGRYEIVSDWFFNNVEPHKKRLPKTPMTSPQIVEATGVFRDHNQFIDALKIILANHYPSAAKDGRLEMVMDQFRRSESETGPDPSDPGAEADSTLG